MDNEDIDNRFTFHPATDEQAVTYGGIRSSARTMAHYLNGILPESREKSLAITHLEEVVYWANASIARHT